MSRVDDFIKKYYKFKNVTDEERELMNDFMNTGIGHISDAEFEVISRIIDHGSWTETRKYTDDTFKIAMIVDIVRSADFIWHLINDRKCEEIDVIKNQVWSMSAFSRFEKMILCEELESYLESHLENWMAGCLDPHVTARIYDLIKDEDDFKQAAYEV